MEFSAYEEGSFSNTIKSLQDNVVKLEKNNIRLQQQLTVMATQLKEAIDVNIALRKQVGLLKSSTESNVTKSQTLLNG